MLKFKKKKSVAKRLTENLKDWWERSFVCSNGASRTADENVLSPSSHMPSGGCVLQHINYNIPCTKQNPSSEAAASSPSSRNRKVHYTHHSIRHTHYNRGWTFVFPQRQHVSLYAYWTPWRQVVSDHLPALPHMLMYCHLRLHIPVNTSIQHRTEHLYGFFTPSIRDIRPTYPFFLTCDFNC